ncbi:MAG: hypothetical protein CfP315_0863 [Candidatus Improbicoccus pseudotrichonymphae]|uniref:Uncharacterized protein n=1 Tax=Candidatus Improbicoccus pseudotrichonymphae TaxID=3033792 RepID=A0AA48HVQ8_9FIRM|nr:MAG: hypothetical protein CfP315_0863 [Candidatus Improbicoccus pseudotrichonymphae]
MGPRKFYDESEQTSVFKACYYSRLNEFVFGLNKILAGLSRDMNAALRNKYISDTI